MPAAPIPRYTHQVFSFSPFPPFFLRREFAPRMRMGRRWRGEGKKRGEAANNKPPHSLPLAMLRASSKRGGGRKQRDGFFCLGPKSKEVLIHLWHPQKNKKVASKQTKRLFPPLSWYRGANASAKEEMQRRLLFFFSFLLLHCSFIHSARGRPRRRCQRKERRERLCMGGGGKGDGFSPPSSSLPSLLSARREVLHQKGHLTHLLPPTVVSGPRIGGGGRGGKRRSSSFFSRRRRRRTAPSSSSGAPFSLFVGAVDPPPSDRRDATRRGEGGKGISFHDRSRHC